jgi:hypothetical protein
MLIRLLPENWPNTARSLTAGAEQSGAAKGWPKIREGGECWCRLCQEGRLLLNSTQHTSNPQIEIYSQRLG